MVVVHEGRRVEKAAHHQDRSARSSSMIARASGPGIAAVASSTSSSGMLSPLSEFSPLLGSISGSLLRRHLPHRWGRFARVAIVASPRLIAGRTGRTGCPACRGPIGSWAGRAESGLRPRRRPAGRSGRPARDRLDSLSDFGPAPAERFSCLCRGASMPGPRGCQVGEQVADFLRSERVELALGHHRGVRGLDGLDLVAGQGEPLAGRADHQRGG